MFFPVIGAKILGRTQNVIIICFNLKKNTKIINIQKTVGIEMKDSFVSKNSDSNEFLFQTGQINFSYWNTPIFVHAVR